MSVNNLNPGVGPTNADIAAAVAAPSLAQITSAITTNAASAGVTNASIASAVTTNAASAGVTMAAINTAVANNASPFGGTWTNLYSGSIGGVSTLNISGLGSYKYLRCRFREVRTINSNLTNFLIRFNGDSSGSYSYWLQLTNGSSVNWTSGTNDSKIDWGFHSSGGNGINGGFDIFGSNSTSGNKALSSISSSWWDGGSHWTSLGIGGIAFWRSNASITSINFFTNNGVGWTSGSTLILDGAN